jgi:hypothetical protein
MGCVANGVDNDDVVADNSDLIIFVHQHRLFFTSFLSGRTSR